MIVKKPQILDFTPDALLFAWAGTSFVASYHNIRIDFLSKKNYFMGVINPLVDQSRFISRSCYPKSIPNWVTGPFWLT